ncbi:MAG: glycoside hydrolase family 9 protein [Mariniphaga sp.]|nr:glycoside hydrolase family 9 protein [Mariniphaga sp.]
MEKYFFVYKKNVISGIILIIIFAVCFSFLSLNTRAQGEKLSINQLEYFEKTGLNILVFHNQYNGMFFDEKTAGIEIIQHERRIATGGAIRLQNTPEQWDQIPDFVERIVDKENNIVSVILSYPDFDFKAKLIVKAKDEGFLLSVELDKPLPELLEGRAGLNLEFEPATYFEKTFLMDGKPGIFPLHPSDQMKVISREKQIPQFANHITFDDHEYSEYLEPYAIVKGQKLVMAPDDPERMVALMSEDDLMLFDGRNVAQNGWFVVRSLIPANKTGKVLEWFIQPNSIDNWIKTPVISHSQVGYHPDQEKIAIIELDKNDTPLKTASVFQITEDGDRVEKHSGDVVEWGEFLRYNYAKFDFSSIKEPGLYSIKYDDQQTKTFQIGTHIYENVWHQTLDVWFPVQMDHMFVNEAYRVWHGAAHLDDAVQAPLNHQHFDGYRMGDTTETQYKPGERIPGLNIGGWFDAGDFDIRTGSHCQTVLSLVESWEAFNLQRDQTLVDKDTRFVDIHHPDGTADILQQIEHGTLALVAQHRAFGRAIAGIIVPNLHQYHHLGDGVTQTDNLLYNPELKPYETVGNESGTNDDRWAFTNKSSNQNYSSIGAISAASRALKGYNDELSVECLKYAEKAWEDEQNQKNSTAPNPTNRRFGGSVEAGAALQLYIATKNDKYSQAFDDLIWSGLEGFGGLNLSIIVKALPYTDQAFHKKLGPFVERYKDQLEELGTENPFGVPFRTGGWAGNSQIISWASTNYLLNKYFPDIIDKEYVYKGINYIFGCHPVSNISFVSGVGTYSKRMAYGNNRADYSFIAGGVVPGVMILKPDYPENKIDWPFLWGENEYVIDISAHYIFLSNAVNELAGRSE